LNASDFVFLNNFQILIDKNWFQKLEKSMEKTTKKSKDKSKIKFPSDTSVSQFPPQMFHKPTIER
jgi:hypothetical protein